MAKSCLSCVHLTEMPMGERASLFCTRNPPSVEVLRSTNDRFQLLGWYPPMPIKPCSEHTRAWWRRAKKPPVPTVAK